MKVKEMIALLMTHDPEHDVVLSGNELKFGCDFELDDGDDVEVPEELK